MEQLPPGTALADPCSYRTSEGTNEHSQRSRRGAEQQLPRPVPCRPPGESAAAPGCNRPAPLRMRLQPLSSTTDEELGTVCSQPSFPVSQQLPPPSSTCPKADPKLGTWPPQLKSCPVRRAKPWQMLPGTQAHYTLSTTTDAPDAKLPTRLLHPCATHLMGHQPLDFGPGTWQAFLQQEGRRSGESSPAAPDSALQSQTVEFHLMVERTHRHAKPHGSSAPGTANANYTVASKSPCSILQAFPLFGPHPPPPFQENDMVMAHPNPNSRILVVCYHKVLQEHKRLRQAT